MYLLLFRQLAPKPHNYQIDNLHVLNMSAFSNFLKSSSLKTFIVLFSFLSSSILVTAIAESKPCYPSDPTDNNNGNLCPAFPPNSITSESFRQGEGRPVRELPTITNPGGKIIVSPTGFWSGSEASGNSHTVRTNKGEVFIFPKNK